MTNTEIEKQETQATETQGGQREQERFVAPRARIVETENAFVLTAEMPGVGKDGVDVSIEEDRLIVTGRRNPETAPKGRMVYRETRQANYRRAFELEGLIDADHVSAKIEHGILRVELPKAESLKPRKIEVA